MQDIATQLPYRALPSLEEAKQVARVSRAQIREFGNIICKHGLHETFGICLLHRHFDVDDSERLVHRHDRHLKQVLATPSTAESSSTSACIWGVAPEPTDQPWVELEYLDTSQFPSVFVEASQSLREQDRFLNDIGSAFCGSGKARFFGLGVFHRDVVPIPPDCILAEFSNDEARTLTVRAASRAEIDPLQNTTTMWRFQPGADPLAASLCCHQHGPTCSGDRH